MSLATIARIAFGVVLAAIGITLTVGGVWLAFLGGSFYYAIAGVLLLASGVAFCLGRPLGFYLYAAAFIPLFIISLLILSEVSAHARQQALEHLRSDARAAASLCDKRQIELRAMAQSLADEIANRALVSSDNLARLQDLLPRAQSDASLDFVIVTDSLGRVIARHNDRPVPGETLLGAGDKNPIAEKVIAGDNLPAASCVIERGERYARLGLDRIGQLPPSVGSTIDEALMIEAGAPIFSGGRFVGVVLVGQMLNTYYKARATSSPLQTPLVAEARQTLYRSGEEDAGRAGEQTEKQIFRAKNFPDLPAGGAQRA